jgi:tetratricopeptide (TPR) repeat protein
MLDTLIPMLKRILGDTDSVVAQALRMKAFSTEDRQARAALLDEAVAIQRRLPGHDSIGIADQLDAEGGRLFQEGRYAQAAASFEGSLRIVERLLPEGHPDRLTVTGNLATALGNIPDLPRAESLARQILAINQKMYPGTDGEAFAHSRIGTIAAKQGRADVAEAEFRAGLVILQKTLAPNHDRIWSELRNLGVAIARQGRREEGLLLLDSAYRMGVRNRGNDAVGPGYVGGQKGYVLLWMGRTPEAAAAINEAYRVITRFADPGHPYRTDAALWKGMLAYAQGNYRESVSQFSAALEQPPEEQVPDSQPGRAQLACALGTALVKVGRTAEARPLLQRACPVFDRRAAEQPLLNQWSREARASLSIR